ncbi:NOL1/NOP2/sun family protein [Plectosphaerella cucumerina]|uniref:Nucleolar protein 2 n=1 Tax=Plectosphaerella cucumerina TaxID=40658 RepID=A0A8K0T298_9PEZI|nr:NOL1/NOP2/sun family protein [Plectosphaerella cucumerina]
MGVGRRMKKQGPPEPLSEAHYAKLKRKAGIPVEPAEAPEWKKRRTANKPQPAKANGAAAKPAAKKTKKPNGSRVIPEGGVVNKGGRGKAKVQKLADLSELDDDELKALDSDNSMPDSDSEDDVEMLGDDFLGGSDDSVVDSDIEDEPHGKHIFSEDEDSDGEEALTAANIEGLSRKIEQEAAEVAADAQAELEDMGMSTNIEGDRPHILDDEGVDTALSKATMMAPDLHVLRQRITDTVRVLQDFSKLGEDGKSRADYTALLLRDVCTYYSYSPYLAEKFYNLFSPTEFLAFLDANESPRPVVIRTNTLKTSRRELAASLVNRGVVLEPVGKWSKVGLQVFESSVPLGATPEYLAGHYILMAASSFLPVMALDPQEGERCLDMASAPGGKVTFMSAMMKNKGLIVANDANKARSKGLIGNIHRMGCKNIIVSNYDAREFPKPLGGFDRVLLDAPCSGTGVIAKDPSVKTNKTETDFIQLPHLQKQLLLAAIDSVDHKSKTGGFICYSTCSVTVEENEQVVNYALSRRPNVKLVDTTIPFGKEGFTSYMGKTFDQSLKLTRRYYPHTYNVDGFFVAKFQKIGPTPPRATPGPADANKPKSKNAISGATIDGDDDEPVNRTPISGDDGDASTAEDDFGGFDDGEDEDYIVKAKRNAMRRRGLDPHALEREKYKTKTTQAKDESATEASEPETTADEAAAEKKEKKKSKEAGKKAAEPVEEKTEVEAEAEAVPTPEKPAKAKKNKNKKAAEPVEAAAEEPVKSPKAKKNKKGGK